MKSIVTAIQENTMITGNQIIKVIPNPFTDNAEIFLGDVKSATNYQLSILDISGKLIFSKTITPQTERMQIPTDLLQSKSMYILEVKTEKGSMYNKLVKE